MKKSSIPYTCPQCNTILELPDDLMALGSLIECNECGFIIKVVKDNDTPLIGQPKKAFPYNKLPPIR